MDSRKDTFAVIHSRKSVRSFTGAPVNKNDLDNIIKAGMAAPTAFSFTEEPKNIPLF